VVAPCCRAACLNSGRADRLLAMTIVSVIQSSNMTSYDKHSCALSLCSALLSSVVVQSCCFLVPVSLLDFVLVCVRACLLLAQVLSLLDYCVCVCVQSFCLPVLVSLRHLTCVCACLASMLGLLHFRAPRGAPLRRRQQQRRRDRVAAAARRPVRAGVLLVSVSFLPRRFAFVFWLACSCLLLLASV
jgi:hypothetical protein